MTSAGVVLVAGVRAALGKAATMTGAEGGEAGVVGLVGQALSKNTSGRKIKRTGDEKWAI